ncbi:hypothetical protein BGV71_13890 [Burkholderia ubonensis]|uniref:hypothetical protein n=1 Tax=Burkholderia ubonensis TaxID=101571 RepID=UPI00075C6E6C|nr:hypothetical protein [Burkholderia ubonensis]KWC34117.1 hypothetical protein WL50_19455 [Burkholderia ubonensis]OJA83246.1 hypothetical protein BGV71_13890 [Burkholderia ubonensis]
MDRDEALLRQVLDALLAARPSNTSIESCEAMFGGCRDAAHAIIDRHSNEDSRAQKVLYDMGLATGFYDGGSGIASGLAAAAALQCFGGEVEAKVCRFEAALIGAGIKHGMMLIAFAKRD